MTTEADTIEAETPLAAVTQTDGEQSNPETEREARALGWVPESEWKGGEPPRGGFKSAEDFVQRGKEVLPLVNKRLKEENAELIAQLGALKRETDDKIARIGRMSDAALKRQRADIEAKYEAAKEAAVEIGDKDAYKAADKAQRDTLKEFDEAAAEPADEKKDKIEIPPAMKADIEEWVAGNPWFKTDKDLNKEANAYHEFLLHTKPGLTLKQNLAKVREHMVKEYPDKFGVADDEGDEDPPARRGSPVESGSRMPSGGKGGSFARLPKEAQVQADKFIKDDGLFLEKGETVEKDLAKARERYAKQYLED
jgi:hypothetical protein